mgnify:FL=1
MSGCCQQHNHDHKHTHHDPKETTQGLRDLPSQQVSGDAVQTPIRIMQMDCPTEERLIRTRLENTAGVIAMNFNLMQRELLVVHQPHTLDAILEAIKSLGFEPQTAAINVVPLKNSMLENGFSLGWKLPVAAILAIASEVMHWVEWPWIFSALLAVLAVALSGLGTYRKGFIALRNLQLNINALMTIAVSCALLIGQWPEAAMVMVLFSIAELLEARSLDRARHAVSNLLQMVPQTAWVYQADKDWLELPVGQVKTGDLVRVRPGERIPLDGKVIKGCSTVNQAPITGESLPVDKQQGDELYAGTINQGGLLEFKVDTLAENSTLARIIRVVEQAQASKAPLQRFVDQFAQYYTPAVCLLALLVAVFMPFVLGTPWLDAIYMALVLLVIACPCALVISTPITLVSGLTAAARHGVLVKGAAYLEKGRKLRWLALDKTGTITQGKPVQTDMMLMPENVTLARASENGRDQDEVSLDETGVRKIAASLAGLSDHPVSMAVAQAARKDGLLAYSVEGFQALAGRGVQGVINGVEYLLESPRRALEQGLLNASVIQAVHTYESQGKTVVLLCCLNRVIAVFAVADTVRPDSRQAIQQLHEQGVKTIMLSGDNPQTVQTIASQVGIDRALGQQMPENKLDAIVDLQKSGMVGMVGDGINDAPALARAEIGFAMGAIGTDTAIETADVALMDDDLRKIPRFIELSHATYRVLVQNIVLALGIKLVFLLLTLGGMGSMWMAVFADMGASLLVVLNGLRLLSFKASS